MARKILQGVITKKSGEKTYKVMIERTVRHARFKKVITLRKQFLAHSENEHKVGDKVYIVASKKLSKMKHFIIIPKDKIEKIKNA